MNQALDKVIEFMHQFKQPIPDHPEFPGFTAISARSDYMHSAITDMYESSDIYEYLEAVLDQLYIALGHAALAGIGSHTMDLLFDEVHACNISKLWTEEEYSKRPVNSVSSRVNAYDRCWCIMGPNGKIIKSPSYKPSNIKKILKERGV